ncbi:uncharacterized protein MONOS_6641 [Monocercomonoides exilis]|uniref:uncharacterized protein n=1 Tax=Monocercomonoides exilis TaxID=2049356 RepID=UPI003559809F|nr:hypothetical protein MONOS_6641 [Monocercomonoides exilis]|eukprot:MONOS_6641.1-p1 / transcript=MONOS_6641.1 / gene=MONOS_6641 / organism=Monocercomonoides_exilis_PA203 / gene_product=unspecified product / transcript_product=unspecified product / location=Mono_scaffold00212:86853-87705(+) / protein_length=111 / sequence_SO=supercontig / SO=protein_coding / is_pseudo=false
MEQQTHQGGIKGWLAIDDATALCVEEPNAQGGGALEDGIRHNIEREKIAGLSKFGGEFEMREFEPHECGHDSERDRCEREGAGCWKQDSKRDSADLTVSKKREMMLRIDS